MFCNLICSGNRHLKQIHTQVAIVTVVFCFLDYLCVCLFSLSAWPPGVSLRLLECQQSHILQRIMGRHRGEWIFFVKNKLISQQRVTPNKETKSTTNKKQIMAMIRVQAFGSLLLI